MPKVCPLSELWKKQHATYRDLGPECWTKAGVPYQISSNAYTAYYFAELVVQLGARTILEIGAGTGRFTYMLLQLLDDLEYHISDISEKNLHLWKANGIDAKMHVYDPLTDEPVCNPDLIIANYVFDAMPQEIYRVQNGKHQKARGRDQKWVYEPCAELPYAKSFDDIAFTYPTSALQLLDRFPEAVFVIGDKGMWTKEQLREPEFNEHGTFSLPVNFHALDVHKCVRADPNPRYDVGVFSKSPLPNIAFPEPPPQDALDRFMSMPNLDNLRAMHYDPMLYLMIAGHTKLSSEEKQEVDKRFYPLSINEKLLYEWI